MFIYKCFDHTSVQGCLIVGYSSLLNAAKLSLDIPLL